MAGFFFDYFPGYLRVAFAQRDSYIHMDLHLSGDIVVTTPCDDAFNKAEPQIDARDDKVLHCWISDVFCAFPDLIRWLEAIVCGVQECAFGWEGEGPDGELRWDTRGRGTGRFRAAWSRPDSAALDALLERRQLVEAFYRGFRSFVESSNYDPIGYENLRLDEVVELVVEDATPAQLVERLLVLPRSAAQRLVDAISLFGDRRQDPHAPKRAYIAALEAVARCAEDSDANRWLLPEWDDMSVDARRRDLVEQVLRIPPYGHSGSRLRSLRSPIIEQWLADEQPGGCTPRASSA